MADTGVHFLVKAPKENSIDQQNSCMGTKEFTPRCRVYGRWFCFWSYIIHYLDSLTIGQFENRKQIEEKEGPTWSQKELLYLDFLVNTLNKNNTSNKAENIIPVSKVHKQQINWKTFTTSKQTPTNLNKTTKKNKGNIITSSEPKNPTAPGPHAASRPPAARRRGPAGLLLMMLFLLVAPLFHCLLCLFLTKLMWCHCLLCCVCWSNLCFFRLCKHMPTHCQVLFAANQTSKLYF